MSPTQPSIILRVSAKAAIVSPSGRALIVREATTGKNNTMVGLYGLVGGRIDSGETFMEGLVREVKEETGLEVTVYQPLYVGEWHPSIRNITYQIIAIFMLCRSTTEQVQLSTEHDLYEWIEPAKRSDFAMMEPDCLVVDRLVNLRSN